MTRKISSLSLLFSLFISSSWAASTYKPNADAKNAATVISKDQLLGHTRYLSSDLLEGRAPASNGDLLAQSYISSQFERLGLQPILPNKSWIQPFELVGSTTTLPKTLNIAHGRKGLTLTYFKDYVGISGVEKPSAAIGGAEIVFVGYGIVAPEYGWDDYKDVNVKGKVLLMMNNDPAGDPKMFAGKTRLYYGRWKYKYEIAAKKGAVGAIIIHTKESAGYPWEVPQSGWTGEQFSLPSTGEPTVTYQGWVTEDSAKKLTQLSGLDLDKLRADAEKKDFKPVPLGARFSISMTNKIRKVKTANVLAVLPGSDPDLSRQAVLYMAHHDHLGKKEDAKSGTDNIFNGALDNATGVASILIMADAFTHLEKKPKRSIIFAAVGAEESGLLGSKYLSEHLPIPAGQISADINIDGVNIVNPTKDVSFIGYGKSSLDTIVDSIAKMQGRFVTSDSEPDKGYFYRSDQFNMAHVGIPSAYFHPGLQAIGKPEDWMKKQLDEFRDKHYHQPSDEMRAEWNLDGAMQDLEMDFYLGYAVAQAEELQKWNPGDEFEATRLKSLAEATPRK